jgi:tRNA(Ile)-lysidine synthase
MAAVQPEAEPAPYVVAVATSGGRDSTALLHATCRAALPLGVRVVALHVHHGLQPQADDWLAHVRRQCVRWQRAGWPLSFRHARLQGPVPAGESVEAWARRERYAALTRMAHAEGVSLVLLAHHRQDQAETVLLQAFRAAGPRGLAGMPKLARRAGLAWARPWLGCDPAVVSGYARRHRLRFVQDPSNQDPRFDRSRLRTHVWPVLAGAFETVTASLAGVAERAQEAAACLDEWAAIDLAGCTDPDQGLRLQDWLALSRARRGNALRAWLAIHLETGPPQNLLSRLLEEWPKAASGARWMVPGRGLLLAYRGRLIWRCGPAGAEVAPAGVALAAQVRRNLPLCLDISAIGHYRVSAWPGHLLVTAVTRAGVPASLLAAVEWRPRAGAEQFQASPGGVPRSLKKQYQAAGIPACDRLGPLLYVNQQLVFVPGLGLDARVVQATGSELRRIAWVPDAVPTQGAGRSPGGY